MPQGAQIVIPRNSPGPVHYEAEMVIVIGRTARDVPPEQALEYVFGVTCGNDVSERYWQNDEQHQDVQSSPAGRTTTTCSSRCGSTAKSGSRNARAA